MATIQIKTPGANKGGRPPVSPEVYKHQKSLRLTEAHWDKYAALGGIEWLRGTIERAKLKSAALV